MASNENIYTVSPSEAMAVIVAAYNAPGKHPVMMWGPPGIGKTAIAHQAAEAIGGRLIDFRLVTTEPVDLRGYPVVVKDSEGNPTGMVWAPPELLPRDGKGILFLDELPQAPTMCLNASSELIYDRKLGNDYVLPDGWMVVAAGNRRTDRAGTVEVPTHIKNRLTHVEVEVKFNDWKVWAEKNDIHEGVINFLETRPQLFHDFKPDLLAFPTPRAWEFVSDYVKVDGMAKTVRRALISGAVGKGAALELESHLEKGKGLPRYEDIIADPKGAPVGSNEGMAYALIMLVGEKAKREDLDAVVTYLKRMRRELVRPAVHKMITREPGFVSNEAFAEFAKGLGEVGGKS